MPYREVGLFEVKEVLRLWLAAVPKKTDRGAARAGSKTVGRPHGDGWERCAHRRCPGAATPGGTPLCSSERRTDDGSDRWMTMAVTVPVMVANAELHSPSHAEHIMSMPALR